MLLVSITSFLYYLLITLLLYKHSFKLSHLLIVSIYYPIIYSVFSIFTSSSCIASKDFFVINLLLLIIPFPCSSVINLVVPLSSLNLRLVGYHHTTTILPFITLLCLRIVDCSSSFPCSFSCNSSSNAFFNSECRLQLTHVLLIYKHGNILAINHTVSLSFKILIH